MTAQNRSQFCKLLLCLHQRAKGLNSSRLICVPSEKLSLKLPISHILDPLNPTEMLLVRVDMLLWVLLDHFLTELGYKPDLLLFCLGDEDLISLLLPVVETHLLLRHITILKSNHPLTPPTHIHQKSISSLREQPTHPVSHTYYITIIMSHNLARRTPTPRPDDNQPRRRKEATIELTSDQSREFLQEEVVWAKVVGHPWWPAVITEKSYPTYHLDRASMQLKRKEVTYRVSFFGEASHAFLEESKIAEYVANRDYFVELALKQSKRCNFDSFKASVRQADITSNNPFEVGDIPVLITTPKKERLSLKDEKKTAYRQEDEEDVMGVQEKQNSTLKAIKTNINNIQKLIPLPFQPTSSQKRVSQYALRLLKDKNKSKYNMKTLKCAVIHALKREKQLKKLNQAQSQMTLQWLKKISMMDIDEFVHSNCRKSEISRESPTHSVPPEQKRTPKNNPNPFKSLSYIYLDELGNKMTSSVPLEPFDFYIDL